MATDIKVRKITRRVSAKEKFTFRYAKKLATGETITGKTISVSPSGYTLSNDMISGTNIVMLGTGGVVGTTHRVKARAITSDLQDIPLECDVEVVAD